MIQFQRLVRAAPTLVPVFAAQAARACTVCDSPAGKTLRANLFGGHFIETLLMVLSPVPVLAAAVALAHLLTRNLPDVEPTSESAS